MLIGVKFCGGCNPRYDRGKAYEEVKTALQEHADFVIAEEGVEYDKLLVIGGCTNCCASYCQYKTKQGVTRIWDASHIEETINNLIKQEE